MRMRRQREGCGSLHTSPSSRVQVASREKSEWRHEWAVVFGRGRVCASLAHLASLCPLLKLVFVRPGGKSSDSRHREGDFFKVFMTGTGSCTTRPTGSPVQRAYNEHVTTM